MTHTDTTHAAELPQADASSLVDRDVLEAQVQDMYRQVAREDEAELHFEVGRPLALRLGYPAALLDAIPPEALASFAGVGYHDTAEHGALGAVHRGCDPDRGLPGRARRGRLRDHRDAAERLPVRQRPGARRLRVVRRPEHEHRRDPRAFLTRLPHYATAGCASVLECCNQWLHVKEEAEAWFRIESSERSRSTPR